MLKSRLTLGLAATILCALLVSCGGGGSIAAETLTKAQVVKRVDAVCAEVDEERAKRALAYIRKDPTAAKSKAGQEGLVNSVLLPQIESELAALKEVKPDRDGSAYETLIAALEAALAEAEASPIKLIRSKQSPLAKPDGLAKEFGFKVCSSFL